MSFESDMNRLATSAGEVSVNIKRLGLNILRLAAGVGSTRDELIAVIRYHFQSMPTQMLARYARQLPLQVLPGALEFSQLGTWFQAEIIENDISVAYELHQLLLERQQAEDQSKGVKAPGDNSNGGREES